LNKREEVKMKIYIYINEPCWVTTHNNKWHLVLPFSSFSNLLNIENNKRVKIKEGISFEFYSFCKKQFERVFFFEAQNFVIVFFFFL